MLKHMNVGFERVPVKIPTIPPSNFSKKLRREEIMHDCSNYYMN